ncbi:chromate transporter [Paralcaligenes sp. KSB-10]|uniref:chromate transporter n=1 Tax=Paralcaligenes sp. KSB-10 TaxID=2901142 RepID=UPI001E437D1B|nr:chromate transporter [Paralcaligenes sp. KSB-10]UHL63285.1 chromate transporter [Paralcaligenes sp. KSB-10]
MIDTLINLFKVFAPLSFLTVGGGQSIIPAIHRESVEVYKWIDNSQFLDLFALSRLIPGPRSLLVTLIGWDAAGMMGALVASFAIFVPAAMLVYYLAKLWARYESTLLIKAIEEGLIPVAAGMILAATGTILKAAEGGIWAWGVAIVSTLLLMYTRVSPFLLLGVGAVLFLLVRP